MRRGSAAAVVGARIGFPVQTARDCRRLRAVGVFRQRRKRADAPMQRFGVRIQPLKRQYLRFEEMQYALAAAAPCRDLLVQAAGVLRARRNHQHRRGETAA